MPRVFVSHSSRDRDFVDGELIPLFRKNGVETWYSRDDIRTAAEWEKTIRDGLRSCDWFLVVLSPRSVESEWVQSEVHWALEERAGRVVPLMLETCDPTELHLKLMRIQYVDFRKDVAAARARLLAVWGIVEPPAAGQEGSAEKEPPPVERTQPSTPLDLVKHDPILGRLVRLYESGASRFASAVLLSMCVVPLAGAGMGMLAGHSTFLDSPCGPLADWARVPAFLLLFGLAPIIGSEATYRWLSLLRNVPRLLGVSGAVPSGVARTLEGDMLMHANRRALTAIALPPLPLIGHIVFTHCQSVEWVLQAPVLYIPLAVYGFVIQAVWWYALLKLAIVVLVILPTFRAVLVSDRLSIDLYREECGLSAITRVTFSFLVLYLFVVGTYLGTSLVELGEAAEPPRVLIAAVALLYLLIPLAWFWALLWPAHRQIATAKQRELERLDAELQVASKAAEAGRPGAAEARRGRRADLDLVQQVSTWPLGRVRSGLLVMVSVLSLNLGWIVGRAFGEASR